MRAASEPEPPFTREDALESLTEGNEAYASFPEEGVTEEKEVGKFHIKKKTEIKNLGDEEYVVTFKVIWETKKESGVYYSSYKTNRGSSMLYDHGGKNQYLRN